MYVQCLIETVCQLIMHYNVTLVLFSSFIKNTIPNAFFWFFLKLGSSQQISQTIHAGQINLILSAVGLARLTKTFRNGLGDFFHSS